MSGQRFRHLVRIRQETFRRALPVSVGGRFSLLANLTLVIVGSGGPLPQAVASQKQIRVVSEAVILDIVVRDGRGRTIVELRPEEVEVFEKGVPQEVLSVRCPSADPVAPAQPDATSPGFETATRDPDHMVSLVLQGLTPSGRALAGRAANDFLGEGLPPRTYVALFRLDRTTIPVLDFTDDRDSISAAIELALGASYEDLEDRSLEILREEIRAGGSPSERQQSEALQRIVQSTSRIQSYHQSQAIVDSLISLVQGQRTIAGRKTVIFFSEGLFIPHRTSDRFQMLVSEANLANVTIYVVDARGVSVEPQLGGVSGEMDQVSSASESQFGGPGGPISSSQVLLLETAADTTRMDVQGPLRHLSLTTGGFFIASNDPRDEMARIREDMSSYCEVAYQPKGLDYDGSFREVKVRIRRKDVRVFYRKGYFALPPTGDEPVKPFEVPMLRARTGSGEGQSFPGVAQVLHYRTTENVVENVVAVRVPLQTMRYREERRTWQFFVHFSILAFIKDPQGRVVRKLSQDYPLSGPLNQLDSFKDGNVFFLRRVSLEPGSYRLESVLFDHLKNRGWSGEKAFAVNQTSAGVALSSLSVVGRIEPLSERSEEETNPLRYEKVKIVPNLNEPVRRSESQQIGFHYVVYPSGEGGEAPVLALVIISEGRALYHGFPPLPAPDGQGHIRLLSSLPVSLFEPGSYEAWALVRQGASLAETFATFEVKP